MLSNYGVPFLRRRAAWIVGPLALVYLGTVIVVDVSEVQRLINEFAGAMEIFEALVFLPIAVLLALLGSLFAVAINMSHGDGPQLASVVAVSYVLLAVFELTLYSFFVARIRYIPRSMLVVVGVVALILIALVVRGAVPVVLEMLRASW